MRTTPLQRHVLQGDIAVSIGVELVNRLCADQEPKWMPAYRRTCLGSSYQARVEGTVRLGMP